MYVHAGVSVHRCATQHACQALVDALSNFTSCLLYLSARQCIVTLTPATKLAIGCEKIQHDSAQA